MMNNDPIIIAGSGSSGTTLLKNILSRSKSVVIGPELSVLNKKILYDTEYSKLKTKANKILTKGTCSQGWFIYRKTFRDHEKFGWTYEDLLELIQSVESFKELIDNFFEKF